MVSCLSRTPAPRASCTRDAIDFAATLRQLPPVDPDDERAGRAALAAAASASGSAAARLIAQAAANHPALAPALVDDRFVAAARDVAKIVGTRPWRRILVAGPSAVVEQAVEAAGVRAAAALNDIGDWKGITAVVLGDGDCATRLSTLPHVRVEFAPLAAASSVIASCDSVLLGAESVHQDGRLLVAEGVTGVTVLAASLNVPVYALVQTIKFESDLLLADTDKQGLEMLSKNLVAGIITEHGEISPSAAALVCKRHGIV